MKRICRSHCLLPGAALLAGLPKKHDVSRPPTAGTQVPGRRRQHDAFGATRPRRVRSEGMRRVPRRRPIDGRARLARKIIYFDFDKSDIKPEFADDRHGARAAISTAHPDLKVKLEGNTDERGTREYNIGLGERRAQAVRRALMLQGVAEIAAHHGEFRRGAPGGRGRR